MPERENSPSVALQNAPRQKNPWVWIPTVNFAAGIPYSIVMTVSVIMYKNLGLSNGDIALYTSWLYLPWVIKPLWSPLVEVAATKRVWIIAMQAAVGLGFLGIAFGLQTTAMLAITLSFLWLLAFSSSTHDIAADGFYMIALSEGDQSFFVGIRSTFYRLALLGGQGIIVMLAGLLESRLDSITDAWSYLFALLAGLFLAIAAYHVWALPRPKADLTPSKASLGEVLTSFFQKPALGLSIAFLLLYRLGEAQLVKLATPFMLDDRAVGGLGLGTTEVGFVYGTVGVTALTIGGILGGLLASRDGLKAWLWPMVIGINAPNVLYVLLAMVRPESMLMITGAVAIEQFGYGFGFQAYMLFMIHVARGPYQTAHYAITTAFMALGMMIPGLFSGYIQEALGYQNFFVWVVLATIPGILLATRLPISADYGKRATEEA